MTPDAMFRIASMTKPRPVAALSLYEEAGCSCPIRFEVHPRSRARRLVWNGAGRA